MLHAIVKAAESNSILVPSLPDLVWGTIAFVVVLIVVWKLVLPNVTKALDARAEAGRIRDQAREDAKKIRAELVEQAQADAARIVANAQTQIEAERSSALTSLRTEVGSLALGLASTVIGESLTDDKRSAAIVDRFLADLETADAAAADARPSGARR